ncbi:RNA polymerase sigma factor [Schlesneria sp. T3-172]|uniref:RNA polymerase sigma factor n=1 Tax=Schlesneria sphaerica TaxID=3373610 RepID=UPI0037C66A52
MSDDEASLVQEVRQGTAAAWEQLIARYEGRLLAFVRSRLQDDTAAEDVVQEAFLGFLVSLPNYNESTPLEAFLFSITAHKLTDVLRRNGRRPLLPLIHSSESQAGNEPADRGRKVSSMARSQERSVAQRRVLSDCLKGLIHSWLSRGEFERLECVELLFVLGWSNKRVAEKLGISEQAVANHKDFTVRKLKEAAAAARLRDVDWNQLKLDS